MGSHSKQIYFEKHYDVQMTWNIMCPNSFWDSWIFLPFQCSFYEQLQISYREKGGDSSQI
jgi:hypothetical protein